METTILYATKHALSQKDTLKLLDSTLSKHLHQSFELNPSALYWLLRRSITYTFSTQMLKQHSSMAAAILNSTLSSPKDSWTEVIPTKFYGSENRFMALNKHLVSGIYFSVNISSILALNPANQIQVSTSTSRKALFCPSTLMIFSFLASTNVPVKQSFNSYPHNL